MNKVLHASDLEDRAKWAQYQQMLQRRQHFHDELRKPVEIPIVETPATFSRNFKDEILRTIPKAFKTKGELLFERLCDNDVITWDQLGTVSINGAPLPNSNIVDLVCDVVRCKKTSAGPSGCKEFVAALRQINVPQEYIGNPQRREQTASPRPTFPSLSARRRRVITPSLPDRRRRLVSSSWARMNTQ